MEVFLGTILAFGFNFNPRGWQFCAGQILSIAQNTALFSLLGTNYGGNGTTTFALPDLRGRSAVGMGNGPGLTPIVIGQVAGTENVTLNITQMPQHNHTATAVANSTATSTLQSEGLPGTNSNPAGKLIAGITNGFVAPDPGTPNKDFAPESISTTVATTVTVTVNPNGGNQPFGIRNPYLGLNYCIAVEGIFPSRN